MGFSSNLDKLDEVEIKLLRITGIIACT